MLSRHFFGDERCPRFSTHPTQQEVSMAPPDQVPSTQKLSYVASLMASTKARAGGDHFSDKVDAPATESLGSGKNPYRDLWLDTINTDDSLSPDACCVAVVIGDSVGIGRIAFTNWQRVNVALGRNTTDYQVFGSIRELQAAGYLGRFQGNRYNHSRGWSLSLPEREL
jgi:hypothetical protein